MKHTIEVHSLPDNEKLAAILKLSIENLADLFTQHEEVILHRMRKIEDGKSLTIAHAIVLDLEKDEQTDRISFSTKFADEITCHLPDPNQADLFRPSKPLDERIDEHLQNKSPLEALADTLDEGDEMEVQFDGRAVAKFKGEAK